MDAKAKLRAELLVQRRALEGSFIQEASLKAMKLLMALEEFRMAERVALYAAFDNEPDTREIFHRAHVARKSVFFPKIDPVSKKMTFGRVRSWDELEAGYGGILEPFKGSSTIQNVNDLQMILVPGVAFDLRGHRLGLGRGYYDRILTGYRGKRIGMAYEFQIVESLPSVPSDQRVDWVVTEERVIRAM